MAEQSSYQTSAGRRILRRPPTTWGLACDNLMYSLKSDSNLMQLARLTTKMEIRHPRNLFNCLFVSLFDDLIPLFPNRRMGWNYCIVDEFHVDVDCADSGDEEGNPDGRIVKHLAVERPQCVLGLLGVRKLHQTPILWRTTLQCYL